MKKIRTLGLMFIFLGCQIIQAQNKNQLPKPKLVVGIVVDQMRWDYLYRFYDQYGDSGFKRLLNDGFSAENTLIPYVPSITAVGHSSIYTGSVPAIHGITGNDFYVRETQKEMYCTQDDAVKGVGNDTEDGRMSPKNLLTSTITDELKLASDFKSKVIGIALKDRGAILPAGHFADAAYWFVDGKWITSDFYRKDLPGWVNDFNQKDYATQYLSKDWNTLYPMDKYINHLKDDNVYEGTYVKEEKVTFPIKTSKLIDKKGKDLIKSTPFGNTLTLQFAKEAIDKEQLGNNPTKATDFLAVSLSSTDYVGHQFAINSVKIEDTYLRLDKDLGEFLSYLDQKVGKGNYTVFLTADHGAAHNPQFIQDEKGNAGFLSTKDLSKQISTLLKKEYKTDSLVYAATNYQIFLDNKLIAKQNLDAKKIKNTLINFLKDQPGILYAVDLEDVNATNIPEPLKNAIELGYHYKRSGDIQLILDPQWCSNNYKTGTTHGVWYPYDTHIPAVFMGWGIKHGVTHRPTYMTDIAPTIAALLHIQQPNGTVGNAIFEILDASK